MRSHDSIPVAFPVSTSTEVTPPPSIVRAERGEPDQRSQAQRLYAKLVLLARDLHQPGAGAQPIERSGQTLRPLIDLARDRLDLVLDVATEWPSVPPAILASANSAMLSVALGVALELPATEVLDLGRAALLTRALDRSAATPAEARRLALSLFAALAEQGRRLESTLGLLVADYTLPDAETEAPWGGLRPAPLVASSVLRVAQRFTDLMLGLTLRGEPGVSKLTPAAAVAVLLEEGSPRERAVAAVLMNLVRVFPVGALVRLDTDQIATVFTISAERPDRPIVIVRGPRPQLIDLLEKDGDRYRSRILTTAY